MRRRGYRVRAAIGEGATGPVQKGNIVEAIDVYIVRGNVDDAVDVYMRADSDLAEALLDGGYLIEVSSELEWSSERPDRYAWTSSKGMDVEVSAGTLATARVAIESERPIDFVFPLIKSAAGVD